MLRFWNASYRIAHNWHNRWYSPLALSKVSITKFKTQDPRAGPHNRFHRAKFLAFTLCCNHRYINYESRKGTHTHTLEIYLEILFRHSISFFRIIISFPRIIMPFPLLCTNEIIPFRLFRITFFELIAWFDPGSNYIIFARSNYFLPSKYQVVNNILLPQIIVSSFQII